MIFIKQKNKIINVAAVTAAAAAAFAVYYGTKQSELVIADNRLPIAEPTQSAETEASVNYSSAVASVKDGVLVCWNSEESEAVVPENVTEIGEGSFKSLTNIQSVYLHTGITKIGFGAFEDCPSLENIYYAGNREQWELIEFDGVMSSDISIIFGEQSRLPDEIVSDGEVLKCWNGDEAVITIPDGITSVAAGAFKDMSNVTEIIIPDSVKYIGDKAFMYCSSLKRVTLPDSVISLGSQAFYGCTSLEQVRLSDNIDSVGNMTFMFCSALKTVSIPANVRSVGDYAFDGCTALERVLLPENGVELGTGALPENTQIIYISEEISAQGYNSPTVTETVTVKTEEGLVGRLISSILSKTDKNKSFIAIPKNISVIRDNEPLSDGDEVNLGDVLFIKAIAPEGEKISMITVNGEPVANSSQYIAGNGNVTIKAKFISLDPEISVPDGVSVIRENELLSDGDSVNAGDELFIKAVAPEGYDVSEITVNGEAFENSSTYTADGTDTDIFVDFLPKE